MSEHPAKEEAASKPFEPDCLHSKPFEPDCLHSKPFEPDCLHSKPFEPDCLHSMTFLTSTDITNPREWYSFSSDTRLGVIMTVLNPETHTLLPTLPGSLAHQAVQSEKSTHGVTLTPLHHKSGRTRHSFSVLENVSRNDHLDDRRDSRNLKSILSSNKNNSHNNQSQSPECVEKASRVKFGENDVKFKDRSLPPIHDQKTDPTSSPASSSKMKNSPEKRTSLNSPRIPLRPDTLEPRGKAFKQFPLTLLCHDTSQRSSATAHMPGNGFPEVCRPVTHTHDDYPEAYWELRSPTVHQPRDLKETMIDRERYRLQQISSLKLGAMSREATINKLDSYRKWNQQIQELSSKLLPSKSTSPQHTSTMANAKQSCKIASDAATNIAVNVDSDQTDDEVSKTKQKFLLPIHQQILDVPTQSNIPCNKTNSIISKLPRITNEGVSKLPRITNEGIGKTPCVTNEGDNIIRKGTSANNSCRSNSQLAESERPRHEKLNSPTKNWIDQGKEKVGTKIKPSVVNLCIVQEEDSHNKDILANIKHALITNPEKSERYRAFQPTDVQQEHQSGSVTSGTPNSMTSVDDGKISLSDSLPSIERSKVPFTPSLDITPPVEESEVDTPGSLDVSNKGTKKIIIKKFKKLDIFGEKSAATENTPDSSEGCVVSVRSNDNRKPYLPQCRPPTYRLDLRSYPPQKDSERKLRENAQAKGGLYSASPVTVSSHLDLRSRH